MPQTKGIRPWLQLLRWPNLLIVGLTQYLIYYLIVRPPIQAQVSLVLSHFQFALLVICTMIIAGGGYIINDLIDQPIDQINKPDRLLIGPTINPAAAWRAYWLLQLIGFGISLYIGIAIDRPAQILIYPIASGLLAWYSYQLKQQLLWGNIVVGVFCTFVPGVVWYAEREPYAVLAEQAPAVELVTRILLLLYLAFAFFSTLLREVVKDMEDVEGDLAQGCRTLPIQMGMGVARRVAMGFGVVVLGLLGVAIYLQVQGGRWVELGYLGGFVLAPLLFILWKLQRAHYISDFHQISQWIKLIMLTGLLYLVVYAWQSSLFF